MSKKIKLSNSDAVGNLIPDEGHISANGVNTTADSARSSNIQVHVAATDPALYPLVDKTCLEAQDANDGSENGDQPSFKMPPFARG